MEANRNDSTGYILAYEPAGFMHSEQGDYGRSWFTQGMIEAGKAGNAKAFPLLRGMYLLRGRHLPAKSLTLPLRLGLCVTYPCTGVGTIGLTTPT